MATRYEIARALLCFADSDVTMKKPTLTTTRRPFEDQSVNREKVFVGSAQKVAPNKKKVVTKLQPSQLELQEEEYPYWLSDICSNKNVDDADIQSVPIPNLDRFIYNVHHEEPSLSLPAFQVQVELMEIPLRTVNDEVCDISIEEFEDVPMPSINF